MLKWSLLLFLIVCFLNAQDYKKEYEKAYNLYRQKKFNKAKNILKNIFLYAENMPKLRYETVLLRGKCFLYTHKYRSAIGQFNAISTHKQKDVDVIYNRAKAYFFLQENELAIYDFSQVLEWFPESIWALYYRGKGYQATNKIALAQSDFTHLLELAPRFSLGWIGLGKIFYEKGKLHLAKIYLQKSIVAKNAETHYYLGIIALHEENDNLAFNAFQKATTYNPNDGDSWFEWGKLYLKKKKYKDALKCFTEAEKYISTPILFSKKGIALYYLNEYNKAISFLTSSLKERKTAKTFFYLGLAHQKLENFKQAIFDYTSAIHLRDEYFEAYKNRGFSYAKQNQYFQAQKDYDYIIDANKADYLTYYHRGNILKKIGKSNGAFSDYTKSITLKNNFSPVYAARSSLFIEIENNIDKAFVDIEKAITLQPEADYFNKRAMLYYHLGKEKNALKDISKAISISGNSKYKYNRGMIYRSREKWQLAIKDFSDIIFHDKKNANAYHSRAITYIYMGKKQQAIDDITKAISLKPEAMYYFHRGRVYADLGFLEKAMSDFDNAIAKKSESNFYYEKANILYIKKEYLDALRECNQAITANPDVADYYFLRANIYKQLENEEDAVVDNAMGKYLQDKEYK